MNIKEKLQQPLPDPEGWAEVMQVMKDRFDKEADVKEILFVMGLREFGHKKKKFTKEDKQDLMNLAMCKAFSYAGYFEVSHFDGEGWPIWKQTKPLPTMNPKEQEVFIKEHIILYFKEEELL